MGKAIIVYESKYGNTRRVAEAIAEGMGAVSGTEAVLCELKEVDREGLKDFDAVVVGSPNHIGTATRSIRKFIDEMGKLGLEGKTVAVFDTYIRGDFEKAVKKMEKSVREKVGGVKLPVPGLSIRVDKMKGPVTEGEMPKAREFGEKVAGEIKT
ncbi:MAG: flavodoxin domain-containing protein [Dehalococcoidales bacterium]